jgi:hypothetical protein
VVAQRLPRHRWQDSGHSHEVRHPRHLGAALRIDEHEVAEPEAGLDETAKFLEQSGLPLVEEGGTECLRLLHQRLVRRLDQRRHVGILYLDPPDELQPRFGVALPRAREAGVGDDAEVNAVNVKSSPFPPISASGI